MPTPGNGDGSRAPFYRLRLAALLPLPSSHPRCAALLPEGGLTCFHARDSTGEEGNSRACARTPDGRQHRACTTGVRKSLKGLVPSARSYTRRSRGTAPCTCWSTRRTGATEISGISSSRHVPADRTLSNLAKGRKDRQQNVNLSIVDNLIATTLLHCFYIN